MPDRYCELHVHLEGCAWPEFEARWRHRAAPLFPPPPPGPGSDRFGWFLARLRHAYRLLPDASAYADLAATYAARAAAGGIVYAEVQVNLALLGARGLAPEDVLPAMNDAVAGTPGGPVVRWVMDLPWQFEPGALRTVSDRAMQLTDLGVRAVSLGGRETDARPDAVAAVLTDVRAAGMQVCCHAGESSGPDAARRLIETLRPDRIAHGIALADWLEAMGPDAPPVDVCLGSNLDTGAIATLADHPLPRWWRAGVPVALSTDDPAVHGLTLADEYGRAARLCPGLVGDTDRRRAYWLQAAADPQAADLALTGAPPSGS
jgi:adenosine deaminase